MIREYIFDHRFSLTLKNNTLDIVNYLEIISFSDDAITLKYEGGNIKISGKDLIISKLLDDELLIKGEVKSIEFR